MAPRASFLRSASLFLFPLLLLPQYANGDTESFEVGDLAQYSTSGVPTPTLTGSEIEVTAIGNPADSGFLMFLSPNLKSSLSSAMDRSCASGFNTGCYSAVIDVLEGYDVLLQARSLEQRDVERRGLDMIVSAALVWVAAILYPVFFASKNKEVLQPLVIPPPQVWEGMRIEEATEIIVVNTASPTTITVPSEQGTPTGSPVVLTTFAAVTGNARRGDVGIKLEPADAMHLQQLLSGADYTCQVDYEMDDLASMMVRGLSMADVVCAAQNLLVDGIDREGYADYLNIDQAQLPFTDAALVAARTKVIAWALLNARLLNGEIQAHTLHVLAVGAFALSWLFLSQAGTISSLNIIAAASLQGGRTATECEQQTATQCTAACGVYTWAPQYDCKTRCATITSCDATPVRTTTATTFKPTYLTGPEPTTEPSSDQGQQFAIASYINPLGDPGTWDRLLAYNSNKVSVLVANVLIGPDYIVNLDWKDVIDQAAARGKVIIGYVRTGYLGVSSQQFTTRLGSHNLADWASQIEQDVDKWFELYGSSLGGIFFDEGWPECGPDNIDANWYADINSYTKRKHPGAFTVLNPGSPIAQCLEDTMDTLLTFESSYETYTSSFVPKDWTPKDPRKIWHIIYRVTQDQVATVAALALSRHAGLVEITEDDNPNPYDTLPNDAYMQAAIRAMSGGEPSIEDPAEVTGCFDAGLPSDAAVSSFDYTSVTLAWSSVQNALGYAVYKNGLQILELPASMNRATIGMLDPGTLSISFEVKTLLASCGGGTSRLLSASTKKLPSSGSMTNISFKQNGDTVTYTADVLVPYALVRLFIGGNQPSPGIGRGWPIDDVPNVINDIHHEIVNYLVKGSEFYSGFYEYTGTWYETSKNNADWSWSPIGTAPQHQSGYTYTWNVPFAGIDAAASEYVIQGQGYAPVKNVFMGDLRMYASV